MFCVVCIACLMINFSQRPNEWRVDMISVHFKKLAQMWVMLIHHSRHRQCFSVALIKIYMVILISLCMLIN